VLESDDFDLFHLFTQLLKLLGKLELFLSSEDDVLHFFLVSSQVFFSEAINTDLVTLKVGFADGFSDQLPVFWSDSLTGDVADHRQVLAEILKLATHCHGDISHSVGCGKLSVSDLPVKRG
jgi:hypothetical protein